LILIADSPNELAPIAAPRAASSTRKEASIIPRRSRLCGAVAAAATALSAGNGLTIHPHPTLSETIGMAAEAFEGTITDLYLPKKKAT
jgi:hypothetical protein